MGAAWSTHGRRDPVLQSPTFSRTAISFPQSHKHKPQGPTLSNFLPQRPLQWCLYLFCPSRLRALLPPPSPHPSSSHLLPSKLILVTTSHRGAPPWPSPDGAASPTCWPRWAGWSGAAAAWCLLSHCHFWWGSGQSLCWDASQWRGPPVTTDSCPQDSCVCLRHQNLGALEADLKLSQLWTDFLSKIKPLPACRVAG